MSTYIRRLILTFAICLAAQHVPATSHADELVEFRSAPVEPSAFRQRLAKAKGEVLQPELGPMLRAFLTKPPGDGPFPAIVLLHGCGGIRPSNRTYWPERLSSWGYVVLVVDSFSTRGIDNTCNKFFYDRVYDAYGALNYLADQRFVDPARVSLLGFSAGGIATLQSIQLGAAETQFDRSFKSAIAFYPHCAVSNGDMAVPTLILIGERDDWTPAAACEKMMEQRSGNGSPVRLVTYEKAHHAFDAPEFGTGFKVRGHWLAYDPAAAAQAVNEVRAFLRETLRN